MSAFLFIIVWQLGANHVPMYILGPVLGFDLFNLLFLIHRNLFGRKDIIEEVATNTVNDLPKFKSPDDSK